MSFLRKIFKMRDTIAVIAIILLFTKLLGLIKFRIIAGLFGATRELDLFWAAFVIPDTVFNVLVAGTINAAVIPVFTDVLHNKGDKKLLKLFSGTMAVILALSTLLVILIYVYAYPITQFLLSRGFLGEILISTDALISTDIHLLVKLMRIMLLSPMLLGVSSILTAYLQVHKRFFITTLAPFLYNLGITIGSIVLVSSLKLGIEGLAWSVVIGSVLHITIQIPLVFRFITEYLNIETFRTINGKTRYYLLEIFHIFRLAVPRILSYLGEQFNSLVNTIISFSLTEGALSAYRFAFSLHLLPVQIFVGAIAQVALPNLAEFYSTGQSARFKETYNKSLHQTLFVILPAVAVLFVLRLPIVRLAYGVGRFDWWDTVITSWCLALFSFAIIGQAVVAITLRALYAIHETKLPFIATVITVLVNIAGSYYLTNFFSHYLDWRPIISQIFLQLNEGVQGIGGSTLGSTVTSLVSDLGKWFTTRNRYDAAVGGLALSLSISFFVEMVLNMIFLNYRVRVISWKETLKPGLKMGAAGFIMAVVMYFVFRLSDFSLDTSRTIYVGILFLVTTGIGSITYLVLCKLFNIPELSIITDSYKYLFQQVTRIARIKFSNKPAA